MINFQDKNSTLRVISADNCIYQCNTLGNIATKIVENSSFVHDSEDNFSGPIWIKFTYTNTATDATLRVNNVTGRMVYQGTNSILPNALVSNGIYGFVWDGTYWNCITPLIWEE